jgi:UDP-glucose 4-epimerase
LTVVMLGASGFLGAWAARALVAEGQRVAVVHRPGSDLWRLAGVDGLDMIEADVEHWGAEIVNLRPSTVVSLDWGGVGSASREDETLQARNVARQKAVVDAVLLAGVGRYVGLGSQAEYGPLSDRATEDNPLRPETAYGRAKVIVLGDTRARLGAEGVAWSWARVFSVFGPLEQGLWLLPSIARAASLQVPIPLTSGAQIWSYLPAPDAGRAIALLATDPSAAGVYNVGGPEARSLRESIETFAEALGAVHLLRFGATKPAAADMKLEPDVHRLRRLGWNPATDIRGELRVTANWFAGRPVADPFSPDCDLPSAPMTRA